MGYFIDSTEERISRALVESIENYTSLRHSDEIDFNSTTLSLPNTFDEPQFNFRIQLLPETRQIPILKLRINIDIAINRDGGDTPFEQELKIIRARDEIIEWYRRYASFDLHATTIQLINSDRTVRGTAYVILLQHEMNAIQLNKEYKRRLKL